jgi:hypothetical protein
MLPAQYQPIAAVVLVAGGIVTCFAGYRLFKVVLGIYGFVLGALVASSMVGSGNTAGMVVAAIVGGVAGAVVLVLAYFVGVALIGAGLGVLVVHTGWTAFAHADPPAWAVIVFAILGGVGAILLQRYVIVVATAFGGAWTILLGVMALLAGRPVPARGASPVWILYPFTPEGGHERLLMAAWILLGLCGTGVQLAVTGKRK